MLLYSMEIWAINMAKHFTEDQYLEMIMNYAQPHWLFRKLKVKSNKQQVKN